MTESARIERLGIVLAAAVGAAGGGVAAGFEHAAVGRLIAIGAAFGFVCALALRGRATSAGAGLIWGLGAGLLLWIVLPALEHLVHRAGFAPNAMLHEAHARFPELVGCIEGIGAPVGLLLGICGVLRPGREPFHWGRAIAAGGAAGLVAALLFSRWMYLGDFYPLISGFGRLSSHSGAVGLHFLAACLIGCSFGMLFQSDVCNLGSAMGWGIAYAMFWWFLGQLTVLPLAAGRSADWSVLRASEQFGPLVGHILYGMILGIVYAGVNALWTRLFIAADPLNRKREGPGVHFLRSLGWGSMGGLAGGLAALVPMAHAGVITRLAGAESGPSVAVGVCVHLLVSVLIGASYGLLFRGETSNTVSGSLWGLVFGLIWWYAGPLTLLPLLRTGECDWRPETAAALLPSLVGHLVFGLVTANVFMAFERRYARGQLAAAPHPRPAFTPAPALWLFVLGIGVLLPVLLSS